MIWLHVHNADVLSGQRSGQCKEQNVDDVTPHAKRVHLSSSDTATDIQVVSSVTSRLESASEEYSVRVGAA